MGQPRLWIVIPLLFAPVAVNFAISWTVLSIFGLSDSAYRDLYPWTLLGIYALFAFAVYRASIHDGTGLRNIINFRRGNVLVDIEVGALIFFALYLLNSAYAVAWSAYLPAPATSSSTNLATIAMEIAALPAASGLVEELLWRGYGISSLLTLTKNRWASILISSLGFGIWHIDLYHFGYSFLGGIFLGYLYTRNRRLLPLVVGHFLLNLFVSLFYLV